MPTMVREGWTDERLDEFGKRMDERFDGVGERIDAGRGETKQELGQVNERLDRLEGRMDESNSELHSMGRAMIVGAIALA